MKNLDDYLEESVERIYKVIGERLKKTKKLDKKDIDKLTKAKKYGYDIEEINKELKKICEECELEFDRLFDETLKENEEIAQSILKFKNQEKNIELINAQIEAIRKVTKETFENLSNTSVMCIKDNKGFIIKFDKYYKDAVDKAIVSVADGVSNWKDEVDRIVSELGKSGIRVQYESGYTRRLDSALRQNILDGISQVRDEMRKEVARSYGADGVEISAHALCAKDHLPYQGKQYTNEEFEQLQMMLSRKIGQWNCGHIATPILIGISKKAYDDEQLKEYEESSNQIVEIDGISKTRYEWSQVMRNYENRIKDVEAEMVLAKKSGNELRYTKLKGSFNELNKKYNLISKKNNIKKRI